MQENQSFGYFPGCFPKKIKCFPIVSIKCTNPKSTPKGHPNYPKVPPSTPQPAGSAGQPAGQLGQPTGWLASPASQSGRCNSQVVAPHCCAFLLCFPPYQPSPAWPDNTASQSASQYSQPEGRARPGRSRARPAGEASWLGWLGWASWLGWLGWLG